jgi:hypothetical protein
MRARIKNREDRSQKKKFINNFFYSFEIIGSFNGSEGLASAPVKRANNISVMQSTGAVKWLWKTVVSRQGRGPKIRGISTLLNF